MQDYTVNMSRNPQLLSNAWKGVINGFDKSIDNLGQFKKKALNTAGYILKESVRDEFVRNMPAAGRPFKVPATSKGGYKITKADCLADAVRQSSATTDHVTVFMGGRDPGSPLFISRMYENDTKDRNQRLYAGKKLAKPRFIGHLTGVHYWDNGLIAGEQEAIDAMNRIFESFVEEQFNKNN